MTENNEEERAKRRVERGLAAMQVSPTNWDEADVRASAVDTIADILHAAIQNTVGDTDPEELVDTAREFCDSALMHFEAEVRGED